mmetsp:Transcript_12480/g.13452  ORF Transcript_12480/g.13452 Transcript_12480/m.13452 type:complete len:394 (-) Transcript_12480:399-1580(-)
MSEFLFNPDSFRLGSELNDIARWIEIDDSEPHYLSNSSNSYSSESFTSSEDSWENESRPFEMHRAFSQDTYTILQSLSQDDDNMSTLTDYTHPVPPPPQFQGNAFDLVYLQDRNKFFVALFSDLQDDNEKQQLITFDTKLQTSHFGARTLSKVAKRVFGKDYLKGSGLSNAKIRDHINLLEMKFYAIACRHLAMQSGFSMTKEAFLKRFEPVLSSFPPQTSTQTQIQTTSQSYDNFYQQLKLAQDESEVVLMFRFLAPVLILEEHGCNHTFFHRKSGLLVALGEFMEWSGRQYTSGGGKTLPTKIREACLDLITGNSRSTRNRKSKSNSGATSSPKKNKKNQAKLTMSAKAMRKQAKEIMESSDSDSEFEFESDSEEMDEEDHCNVEYQRSFY